MYNLTKGFLKKISLLPRPVLADFLMEKVKEFLVRAGEDKAVRWLSKYWTGDRGRFTQGHAGYGCPADNNGEESNWGRMKKLIPRCSPYYVFMATCLEWIKNKCRDQEAQDAARSEDSWCLPNQPILGKELWRDVRKLTVSDLRNWSVVNEDPSEWNGMLDTMEGYMETNHVRSLARAIVTWNSTNEEPLLQKRSMGTVVYPTSAFLTVLGKGYRFNDGIEARRERAIYIGVMVESETNMVRMAHDLDLEYVLNNTQYFQHATVLNSPWAPHAQFCCSCKDCFRDCVCVHTLMLSLICEKIEIPELLDERILEGIVSAKKSAQEYAGVCREKELDSQRELIFEVRELVTLSSVPSE